MKILTAVLLVFSLSACSERGQVRLGGTVNMGALPTDMKYQDGTPQIVTVSTESDGDINIAYLNMNGNLVVQLYGCAVVNFNCTDLHKQGRYQWTAR